MQVRVLDLKPQFESLRGELSAALLAVCEEQDFILGRRVEALELEISRYVGVRHAVGVSSGSDALLLSLLALGLSPGDEVITTPFSFYATAGSILRAGLVPRFADVTAPSFNLDPRAVAAAITPRTRAILVVHLYGMPADLEALTALADRHGLALIEDAAQALGSEYEGRKVGSFGALGCLSFHPSKVLGAFGDAGMVLTSDPALAEKVRRLRVQGASSKHRHELAQGGNHRLDALQAAVLSVKLPCLERWLALRAEHAVAYDEALLGLTDIELPPHQSGRLGNHALYTLRVKSGRREALAAALAESGIESAIHYPEPLHVQPALQSLGYRNGDFPGAEAAARAVLSLPLYPELEPSARARVVFALRSSLGS